MQILQEQKSALPPTPVNRATVPSFQQSRSILKKASYTCRTSNFCSARGGAWVSDKGFASMELA